MDSLAAIKELKAKHNCKSVTELVKKGVDIPFSSNIVFKHDIDLSELTSLKDGLPEELPMATKYSNLSLYGAEDVVGYLETYEMDTLVGIMSNLYQRSDFIKSLLKFRRYEKVIYLMTRNNDYYCWSKTKKLTLSFNIDVMVEDEETYNLINKRKTPKSKGVILHTPGYTKYIGKLTIYNLKKVIEKLLNVTNKDVLNVLKDEIISKNLILENYTVNINKITYEFYYVFHELLFEWNVEFPGHEYYRNSVVSKHIEVSINGASEKSYAKIHDIVLYPSKYDLIDDNYKRSYAISYLNYKYDKYSNNQELGITGVLKLIHGGRSIDEIVENNYFCPNNFQLDSMCSNESDIGLVIGVLPKQLVRLHLGKCRVRDCAIKKFTICRTKRAC